VPSAHATLNSPPVKPVRMNPPPKLGLDKAVPGPPPEGEESPRKEPVFAAARAKQGQHDTADDGAPAPKHERRRSIGEAEKKGANFVKGAVQQGRARGNMQSRLKGKLKAQDRKAQKGLDSEASEELEAQQPAAEAKRDSDEVVRAKTMSGSIAQEALAKALKRRETAGTAPTGGPETGKLASPRGLVSPRGQ